LGRGGDFLRFEAERALEFASLEDAYVTSRYFPREFSREEAERLRGFVEEVERFVG
jgi:HEPN domain-containing protein